MWKRIAGAALCGAAIGVLGTVISAVIAPVDSIGISEIAVNCLWRAFVFTLLSVVAVLFTEIKLPAPKAG
jgi:predicted ABC-type sugar transport system permease subunit